MPQLATRTLVILALLMLAACGGGPREPRYQRPASVAPPLALDHATIAVPDAATAAAMLEAAGFRVVPGSNRIAFENGYVELAPGPGAAAAPFAIAFRRTATTPAAAPFGPRAAGQIGLALADVGVDEAANAAAIAAGGAAAEPFLHSNGARRITNLRVSAPMRAALPAAASFVNLSGAAELRVGSEWLMELELDHGAQNQELDLRPRLPLVIRL